MWTCRVTPHHVRVSNELHHLICGSFGSFVWCLHPSRLFLILWICSQSSCNVCRFSLRILYVQVQGHGTECALMPRAQTYCHGVSMHNSSQDEQQERGGQNDHNETMTTSKSISLKDKSVFFLGPCRPVGSSSSLHLLRLLCALIHCILKMRHSFQNLYD